MAPSKEFRAIRAGKIVPPSGSTRIGETTQFVRMAYLDLKPSGVCLEKNCFWRANRVSADESTTRLNVASDPANDGKWMYRPG
jgi:hypothetical protein